MAKVSLNIKVNGLQHQLWAEPSRRLLDLLREDLGLIAVKEGCGEGECGACTVILNGRLVNACLVLAVQADGGEVLTVEGLDPQELGRLEKAFLDEGAVQCGYCTPGMILAAKALLDQNPFPARAEIKRALSGNLCRCTGYWSIIQAVEKLARGEK